MSGRRSTRSLIAEIHDHNCNLTMDEIARRVGCDKAYVACCMSQLGRKVGVPGSDKPVKIKPTHSLVEKFRHEPIANQFCKFVWLSGGQLHRCGMATDGHTYCPSCNRHRASQKAGSNYRNYTLIGVVNG